MRAFVALALPDPVRAALFTDAGRWHALFPEVTWVRPDNAHVTLKFLGTLADDGVAALWGELAAGSALAPGALALTLRGLGAFPEPRNARVLWVGVEEAGPARALPALAARLEDLAARRGVPREERAFLPHVTIGRARRRPVDARQLVAEAAGRSFGHFAADEVRLYESRTGGADSVYIERGRIPIGQGEAHGQ